MVIISPGTISVVKLDSMIPFLEASTFKHKRGGGVGVGVEVEVGVGVILVTGVVGVGVILVGGVGVGVFWVGGVGVGVKGGFRHILLQTLQVPDGIRGSSIPEQ